MRIHCRFETTFFGVYFAMLGLLSTILNGQIVFDVATLNLQRIVSLLHGGKLLRVPDPNVTDESRRAKRVIFGRFDDSITSHLSHPGNFSPRTRFINSELYKYICGKKGIVKSKIR